MINEIGSPEALKARASDIANVQALLKQVVDSIAETSSNVGSAGDNQYTNLLRTALDSIRSDLQQIDYAIKPASSTLSGLASELTSQKQAIQRTYGSNPTSNILFELGTPYAQAQAARQAAADSINKLTRQFDPPQKKSGFWGDLWNGTVGGLLSGLGDLWGLTGEAVYNPKAAGGHWSSMIHGFDELGHEFWSSPGHTTAALWDAINNKDLKNKDTAAWVGSDIFNIATLFVGGGFLKLGKASKLADAVEIGGGTARLSATSKLLASFPALEQATVRITDLSAAVGKWDALNHFKRGYNVEDVVAMQRSSSEAGNQFITTHLHSNHPTIDLWNKGLGKITSVKSIDPALDTYKNSTSAFTSKLQEYETKLKDYAPTKIDRQFVAPRDYKVKELLIALPDSGLSPDQASALNQFVVNSQKDGIIVTITEFPR